MAQHGAMVYPINVFGGQGPSTSSEASQAEAVTGPVLFDAVRHPHATLRTFAAWRAGNAALLKPVTLQGVRALAHQIRHGPAPPSVIRVLPHLLIRLPGMQVQLSVTHQGVSRQYGIHFDCRRHTHRLVGGACPAWEPEGEVFLATLHARVAPHVSGVLRGDLSQFRGFLADLILQNLDFVAICQEIARRYPDEMNPDRLVRQCWCRGGPSLEGLQVLGLAEVTQPAIRAADLENVWLGADRAAYSSGRSYRSELFDQGYDLLQAERLMWSGGLSKVGQEWLASHQRWGVEGWGGGWAALKTELGWLLYVHGSSRSVALFIGSSLTSFYTAMTNGMREAAADEAAALLEASMLRMPPRPRDG